MKKSISAPCLLSDQQRLSGGETTPTNPIHNECRRKTKRRPFVDPLFAKQRTAYVTSCAALPFPSSHELAERGDVIAIVKNYVPLSRAVSCSLDDLKGEFKNKWELAACMATAPDLKGSSASACFEEREEGARRSDDDGRGNCFGNNRRRHRKEDEKKGANSTE